MSSRNIVRFSSLIVALALVVTVGSGCKHKKNKGLATDLSTASTNTAPETTSGTDLPDAELEKLLWGDAGLQKVYFDYNSSALRADSMEALKKNAELLKQAEKAMIQIEGHCDERGSQEYNLALGERRALAVRDFLINLGISGDRMITISYGEEKPENAGHDEGAWSKNRRVQFNKAM